MFLDKYNIPRLHKWVVELKIRTPIILSIYSIIFFIYLLIGVIAAHPYDEVIYAQHAQFFYYLAVNPAFSLPMGLYYDLINIGSYFVTILFSFAGISNVLTVQIGVKSAFIVFTFLTSYFLYKIATAMGYSGHYASLLLLTSPIYVFTSVIYGSAIVVSVFFLVSSFYFLSKHSTLASAIFFGMAAGTYVYPIFSFPFLLRYVYVNEGKRKTLVFFFVASSFAAIGQLSVLLIYARMGFFAVAPTTPGGYLSAFQLPYYSIFDIFKIIGNSIILPGVVYNYLYYALSIIASFSYFLLKREKVNEESLLSFFLIQGILFSSLNPYNLPSYLIAIIPFAILFAFIKKRWIVIGLLWVPTTLSLVVLQTINSVGFLIYFSDVNTKLLNINNSYPPWLNSIAGFLYSLSLLAMIPLVFKLGTGKFSKFKKSLISQLLVTGVFAIIAIVVLASASGVPSSMLLENKANTFQGQPVSESLSGSSLVVEYDIQIVSFLSKSHLNYFIGSIEVPSSPYVIYNTSRDVAIPAGNFSENLTFGYPVNGTEMSLFGMGNGSITAELVNNTNNILPTSSISIPGSYFTYSYVFDTMLSGSYVLVVSSDVSLFGSSSLSPSILVDGIPDVGTSRIGGYTLFGNYIPGDLLESKLFVTFTGPFRGIPPFVPTVIVYLGTGLVQLVEPELIEGALMFLALVIIPPSLVLYSSAKAGLYGRK